MKCHYEVLGVERDADDSTIKKAYRKIALQLHPDKNPDRIEECTQLFHEVQAAYDVLSDKQERTFYDKHREAILKGGDDYVDNSVDLMHYYNASCYKGFDDSANGFYSVYRNLFRKIAEEDEPYLDGDDADNYYVPDFGEMSSDYEEIVKPFYSYWLGYCTKKSYVWKEKYDIRDAPNRPTQRLMEKENKKIRDACKRKRNEEVRALVSFVQKRDKRFIAYRKELEKKQESQKRKFKEKQEEARINRNKLLENYEEQDWMSLDTNKLDDIDAHFDEEFGSVNKLEGLNDDDFDEIEEFYCVACDKTFKSEKALHNHEKSKKHKENVELIKNEMEDELLEDLRVEDIKLDEDIEGTKEASDFHRVNSLNLVENAVKLNIIEKHTHESHSPPKCNQEILNDSNLRNTTDSLVYTKMKGVGSKGSFKIKEKKKKGKSIDFREQEYIEQHSPKTFHPKDSLYLPRKKSNKQQIHDSAERLRNLNKSEQSGLHSAILGGSRLTDSMALNRRKSSKAERKKRRRQLLEKSDDSSNSTSSNDEEMVISVGNIDEEPIDVKNNENTREETTGLSPLLQRTVVNDSICYNKEKMEHHGKNQIHQKKFQEILEEDENAEDDQKEARRRRSKKNKDSDTELHKCGVCMKDFPTRNKLFEHIKNEGHALLKEGNGLKKSKKKGQL